MAKTQRQQELQQMVFHPGSFSRLDEEDDAVFYQTDRFVQHLDSAALEAVRNIIGTLIVETSPVVLDLMASFDSHMPPSLSTGRVVGVGMNRAELEANPLLDSHSVIDLNRTPLLPYDDKTFDVVLNTVSVDYLTRPFEVFREVVRVLKPGGLHLVVFSNRMFRTKAVRVWREATEQERVLIVRDYFEATEGFEPPNQFSVKGTLRPEDDKYAGVSKLSDPVYAVWADKAGGNRGRARPVPEARMAPMPSEEVVLQRKAKTRETLSCPYCEQRMGKWELPMSPFSSWDAELLYVCMNDACPYVQRGWNALSQQGVSSTTYRLTYDPNRHSFMPLAIPNLQAIQDNILNE